MADIALDAEALRRDRQRYQRLLEQVQQEIATWNERAEHLQTAIGGLDRLLALVGDDGSGRAARTSDDPTAKRSAAPTRKAKARAAEAPPPAPATPHAPEPVEPPVGSAAEAPRGTDALRLVLEGEPERSWSLPELLEALGARGWLPTSRRPEEGVRISLKRLVERGGANRTDDGRWRRAGAAPPAPDPPPERWPEAEPPLAPHAPRAEAAPAAEEPPPGPSPPTRPSPPASRPAPSGRPVGATVTEC